MYDEHLAAAVKDAGDSFTPPAPDVRGIARRGRNRLWTTRLATAASIVLIAGGAAAVVRVAVSGDQRAARPAAAPSLQWTPIARSPLEARRHPVSVWTGRELIVWGGAVARGDGHLVDGASYDPEADAWTKLPRSPLKTSVGRSAVWTGSEMILWGGEHGDGSHRAPDTGAAYDPVSRTWRRLPRAPYWSLAGHSAVWSGTEMIVWGGVTSGPKSGATYNPTTNRWRDLPAGPLDTRHGHEGVWTGDRLIVWGGRSQDGLPVTGGEAASFDPASRVWTPVADSPLEPADTVVSVWTGDEMIVAGGFGPATASAAGAAYDPLSGTWRKIRDVPGAQARDGAVVPLTDLHTRALWTGDSVVLVTADGVLSYEPGDDRWGVLDAPGEAALAGASTAWTGEALIVWGGAPWDSPVPARSGWMARY